MPCFTGFVGSYAEQRQLSNPNMDEDAKIAIIPPSSSGISCCYRESGFFVQLFLQCGKSGERFGVLFAHRGETGFGKNRFTEFGPLGARIKRQVQRKRLAHYLPRVDMAGEG